MLESNIFVNISLDVTIYSIKLFDIFVISSKIFALEPSNAMYKLLLTVFIFSSKSSICC